MARRSLEKKIRVLRTLFDRYDGETFRASVYDEARARALVRTAELEEAIDYTLGCKLKLYTADFKFIVEPNYTFRFDRDTREYVFSICFTVRREDETLGRMVRYIVMGGWVVICLDKEPKELLVPSPYNRLSIERAMELDMILDYSLQYVKRPVRDVEDKDDEEEGE